MSTPTRPRWTIADVLDRTDLAALLDEHAPSTGSGNRRRWHCPVPDHHDNHASVTMHTDARGHERWRCWSGDDTHRGDAVDLVMITHRLDRARAMEHLAARAGLRLDEPLPPTRRRSGPAAPSGPVPLDASVDLYVAACERILWTRAGRPVRDWLAQRGFTEDLLRRNHVGADPGRDLLRRAAGLPVGRSIAATFPALDPEGALTYVQTRYLNPMPGGPKYENPAARLGTNPRLAWTFPVAGVDRRSLVVCEGIPDALTAAGAGLPAVGVLGAQVADERVADQLSRYVTGRALQLVAVIDADDAGRAWGQRLANLLNGRGHAMRVIEPPDGLDLNAWATTEPLWHTRVVTRGIETAELGPDPDTRVEVSLP